MTMLDQDTARNILARLDPRTNIFDGLFEMSPKIMREAVAECETALAPPMDEGELWSWVRSVMSQGADIRVDYDAGTHKGYEAYSARLDAAAAERAQELWARLKTPNGAGNRPAVAGPVEWRG